MVCRRAAGERLVFFRQFEQPRTGWFISDVGGEGSVASGAGEQSGRVVPPPNGDRPAGG